MPSGKRYRNAAKLVDRDKRYLPTEAISLVKQVTGTKFDETVELAMHLGVDPRKADQQIRGTVGLPSGSGKTVRIAVFAAGDAAAAAREAGADVVGADDLIEQITGGFMDFDLAIATPDLMGQVGKLGRQLGPRGLMPNPKTGTVTTDVGKAVSEFKGGRVEYRTDKFGNVHVPLGKASFSEKDLLSNLRAVLDEILRAKPASTKGKYVKSVALSATMSPGIRVDVNELRISDEDIAAVGA